jgi:hypothetical protein
VKDLKAADLRGFMRDVIAGKTKADVKTKKQPTLAPLALQAQKIVTRYGLSASLARTVAELAFNPGRRR